MGDDTWMPVFSDAFQPNLTFPYDSFNVEDLHTVDQGVIDHLFPLLEDSDKKNSWDFLIGHFLGVDHVGHRMGPDHPNMKSKLEQMDRVLRRVVDGLEDDTLLVVLGDHGMDRKGDHGGDSTLETSSALWIYSKGMPLASRHSEENQGQEVPYTYTTFPGSPIAHRSVQQVDLVPSLSLLLGLPIPFNNLGTVIPELFTGGDGQRHRQAMELNAVQIARYLDVYRSSASGAELDGVWNELQAAYQKQSTEVDKTGYTRLALNSCRALWAQFNAVLMGMGLGLLGVGVVATWVLYNRLAAAEEEKPDGGKDSLEPILLFSVGGSVAGAVVGVALHQTFQSYLEGTNALETALFSASLLSSIALIITAWRLPKLSLSSMPLPLILHTLAFGSNSFTIWEDRIVLFLLLTSLLPSLLKGLSAPTARLRNRILFFGAIFAVSVRLIAMSTVCREEQHPFCHVSFYASSTVPSPPLPVLLLSIPTAIFLPSIIRLFLASSKSDNQLAASFLPWLLRPVLLAGTAYWLLEHADSSSLFGAEWNPALRVARTLLARCAFSAMLVGGVSLWYLVPTCLDISVTDDQSGSVQVGSTNASPNKQATILGFANAFGAPYLIFWTITLGTVFVTSQLTSQIVLALGTIALLAHLELTDSIRDIKALQTAFTSTSKMSVTLEDLPNINGAMVPITFADITPLILLAVHTFHGTGHQAVISSVQWISAFMLTPTLSYPFSPLTVALNTFGPCVLFTLSVPLLALWNAPPLPQPSASKRVTREAIRAGLGAMLYAGTLLVGSAGAAAVLRRHLMVWKIFAPRFMTAAVGLIAVDVGVLLGVCVGVHRVSSWMARLFANFGPGA